MTDLSRDWGTAAALLRADFRRRLELEGRRVSFWNVCRFALKSGGLCVVAYRINTWLYVNGHPILSKIIETLQYMYTGMEIHLGSVIGGGLVLADTRGIGVHKNVRMGKNCTILGASNMTLGGMENIDFKRDFIFVGDHCIIGFGVQILGPLTLANETQIKPNSIVLTSCLVPGSILNGIPARRRGNVPGEAVAKWNPLRRFPLSALDAPMPAKEAFP